MKRVLITLSICILILVSLFYISSKNTPFLIEIPKKGVLHDCSFNDYKTDGTRVFLNGKKLELDPTQTSIPEFEEGHPEPCIWRSYAFDSNRAYYNDKELIGVDIKSLKITSYLTAEDKNGYFISERRSKSKTREEFSEEMNKILKETGDNY